MVDLIDLIFNAPARVLLDDVSTAITFGVTSEARMQYRPLDPFVAWSSVRSHVEAEIRRLAHGPVV